MMMQKAVTIATQTCHLRKGPCCMLLLQLFYSLNNQRFRCQNTQNERLHVSNYNATLGIFNVTGEMFSFINSSIFEEEKPQPKTSQRTICKCFKSIGLQRACYITSHGHERVLNLLLLWRGSKKRMANCCLTLFIR